MARQRMLHPGFFTDPELLALPPLARLLYAGMWCLADRDGRLEDKPLDLKIKLLPADTCDAEDFLQRLQASRRIVRYVVGGQRYIAIRAFAKYQHPHWKEPPGVLPPPPEAASVELIQQPLALDPVPINGATALARSVEGRGVDRSVTETESVTDQKKLARTARSPFAEATALLADVYLQKRGCKYKWLGAQDSNALKRILAVATPQEAAEMFGVGLDQTGYKETNTVAQLDSKWNDLSRLRPNVATTLKIAPSGPKRITDEERARGIYEGQATK